MLLCNCETPEEKKLSRINLTTATNDRMRRLLVEISTDFHLGRIKNKYIATDALCQIAREFERRGDDRDAREIPNNRG